MHRVTVDRSAAVAVVVARGEPDAYSAPDLEAAFADVGTETRVVVDLDPVSFLDSTALGAVVRAGARGRRTRRPGARGATEQPARGSSRSRHSTVHSP